MPASPTGPADEVLNITSLDATPGDPESVVLGLRRLLEQKMAIVVAMDGEIAADRVSRTLAENGLAIDRLDRLVNIRSAVVPIGIHKGFVAPDLGAAVLGERRDSRTEKSTPQSRSHPLPNPTAVSRSDGRRLRSPLSAWDRTV